MVVACTSVTSTSAGSISIPEASFLREGRDFRLPWRKSRAEFHLRAKGEKTLAIQE
jgi:hypothetical protein